MTTSTKELTVPAAAPRAAWVGQSTAIEQSRAVAEVQAAIYVAQNAPRDPAAAQLEIRTSCSQRYLAEKAFYGYRRGGQQVTGPTVHLARELARCWGNIQHGVVELDRDDARGRSEMMAYAWDMQTNTRVELRFIVPHFRTSVDDAKMSQLRDIYENNANNGARRLRECIFGVLPPWLVEDAKVRCQGTLDRPTDEDGNEIPIDKRRADVLARFADLGVTQKQLEANRDRPAREWTGRDIADLGVLHKSVTLREASIEDLFPTARVTADDIKKVAAATQTERKAPPASATAPPAETPESSGGGAAGEPSPASPSEPAEDPTGDEAPEPATRTQLTRIHTHLGELGVTKREDKLPVVSTLMGRTMASSSELTKTEAEWLSKELKAVLAETDPAQAFDAWLSEMRIAAQQKAGES